MTTVVAIELGGTKAIAVLARGRTIVDELRVATTTPEATLGALAEAVAAWMPQCPLALGIATFGPVTLEASDHDFGRIAATPKPYWSGADVLAPFARLGLPIALDTDVNAAAIAEGRWGASQRLRTHAYLTIGTGIGLGLIVEGRPAHGLLHPELGHQRFRRSPGDAFTGVCPFHTDCIEGLASGPALIARTGVSASHHAPNHAVWAHVAHDLAELATAIVFAVAPARIAVGGGVGWGQRHHLLPRVAAGVAERIAGYLPARIDPAAIIVPAGLGESAGPLGAVALALGRVGA